LTGKIETLESTLQFSFLTAYSKHCKRASGSTSLTGKIQTLESTLQFSFLTAYTTHCKRTSGSTSLTGKIQTLEPTLQFSFLTAYSTHCKRTSLLRQHNAILGNQKVKHLHHDCAVQFDIFLYTLASLCHMETPGMAPFKIPNDMMESTSH
jgi:hypothetical protein